MPDAGVLAMRLWATNLAARDRPKSLDAWLARVERHASEAKRAGAELLVMPEYACLEWLTFAPPLALTEEVPWLAARADDALPQLSAIAGAHDIALLAGTMPQPIAHGERALANRAVVLLPDGTIASQDKMALTPWERDDEAWLLEPARALRIVRWRGMRIAISICFDVEAPALAAAQLEAGVDLLVVPSMTLSRAGYVRVFTCAKARAVELACPVAVVGAVGTVALSGRDESNVSGAALYVPCEPGHDDGVLASIGPFETHDGDGPVLDVEAPIGACRKLRDGGSEVWPPTLPDAWTVED